jgi:PAS domain S-box-containing protein
MQGWTARYRRLSIRAQILLLVAAVLLPMAAMFTWFRIDDAQRAREDARAKVQIVATNAARNLEQFFERAQGSLARLAARPQVRALDAARCDPIIAEYVRIHPEFTQLGVRDREGRIVCSYLPNPIPRLDEKSFPWFGEGLRAGGFHVGGAFHGRQSGRWVAVLTHPVRDDAGKVIGLLALPVDLLKLGEQLFESVTGNAIVTVTDRQRRIVLRSAAAETYVGKPAPAAVETATHGMRAGELTIAGADGVRRLYTFQTLPGMDWRVVAGLPEADVYAGYARRLERNLAIGLGTAMLALLLAWWMGGALARPIAALARTAARVAAGEGAARAEPGGSVEIAAVASQFNRMLDARDRDEAAVRASEESLSITLQSIGDGVIATDRSGLVARINPAAERLTGWTQAEAAGRPLEEVFRIVDARTRTPAPDPVRQVLLRGEVVGLSNHTALLSRDGGEYQISDSAAPIRDRAGDCVGVVLVFNDVTDQYRARQARDALQDRLAATLDAIPDLLFQLGLDGRYYDYHSPRTDLLAAPPDAILGRTVSDILPPDAAAVVLAALREAHEKGGSSGRQFRLPLPQGEAWFELSVSHAIAGADGPRFVVLSRDITARKKIEGELRESAERLRTIIETEPECVKVVDRAGRLLEMNAAGLAMLEAESLEQATRQPLGEYIVPGNRHAFASLHARVMRGETGMLEFEVVGLKGTRRWLETHAAPMRGPDGEIAMLLGVTRDITARKRLEEERASLEAQLRQAQKMEAIGTLAGGIAHDFNNALATILGNADLARRDAAASPRALESLEEIAKAARRARGFVQQILSFSRPQPSERRVTDLQGVIGEAVRLLRSSLPARIRVEGGVSGGGLFIDADPAQIEQALLNLGVNAAQAMPARPGRIDIRAERVELDLAAARALSADLAPGAYVRLAVTDDGEGMNAATRARIFEPFFTTKPAGEGTGLGLAVVHGIVRAHGGAIAVRSEPGQGASFELFFPASTRVADAVATGAPAASLPGGGQHVLYLDDDEALVFLMTRLLRRHGYRASGYVAQAEALAAVRADPAAFDLVVTDYDMPGQSGLDVAAALRAIRPDLPLAIASGFITDELRAGAGALGLTELIFKANVMEEFCDTVERLLGARAAQAGARDAA